MNWSELFRGWREILMAIIPIAVIAILIFYLVKILKEKVEKVVNKQRLVKYIEAAFFYLLDHFGLIFSGTFLFICLLFLVFLPFGMNIQGMCAAGQNIYISENTDAISVSGIWSCRGVHKEHLRFYLDGSEQVWPFRCSSWKNLSHLESLRQGSSRINISGWVSTPGDQGPGKIKGLLKGNVLAPVYAGYGYTVKGTTDRVFLIKEVAIRQPIVFTIVSANELRKLQEEKVRVAKKYRLVFGVALSLIFGAFFFLSRWWKKHGDGH